LFAFFKAKVIQNLKKAILFEDRYEFTFKYLSKGNYKHHKVLYLNFLKFRDLNNSYTTNILNSSKYITTYLPVDI